MYTTNRKKKGGKKKGTRAPRVRDPYAKSYGAPSNYKPGLSLQRGHDSNFVKKVCSVLDPFCVEAKGSKYPDQAMTPSIAYSTKSLITMGTLATGNAMLEIRPNLSALHRIATAIDAPTGDVTTLGATAAHPDFTFLNANFISYRIVSWGVHYFSSCNVTESKGFVNIITNNSADSSTNLGVHSSTFMESQFEPLYGLNGTWIAKNNGPESQVYNALSAFHEHTYFAIGISGATASINAVTCEVFFHLELLPIHLSSMSLVATAALPYDPAAMAVISNVAATTKFAENEDPQKRHKTILDRVNNALGVAERAITLGERAFDVGVETYNKYKSASMRIGY